MESWYVCCFMYLSTGIHAADSIQTEFERFLSFVQEHPQGGTFEMQGDMIIQCGYHHKQRDYHSHQWLSGKN
ncbi:MAG: hypothetical protein ACLTDX_11380 [[Clostridium] innocuum]